MNDERIAQSNFPGELRRILISGTFDTSVSFKQLLNCFARRYGSTYYTDVLTQQGRPLQDYYQMYTNLALLGVNTELVNEKAVIKDKLNKLEKAKSVIEGYDRLLEDSNIKDLQDELAKLIKEKDEFVIAENYDKYKREADGITVEQFTGCVKTCRIGPPARSRHRSVVEEHVILAGKATTRDNARITSRRRI